MKRSAIVVARSPIGKRRLGSDDIQEMLKKSLIRQTSSQLCKITSLISWLDRECSKKKKNHLNKGSLFFQKDNLSKIAIYLNLLFISTVSSADKQAT